jgi:hypothetical protein
MTTEDLTLLEALDSELKAQQKAYQETIQNLKSQKLQIESRCDHQYPDGQSAIEGGFMCSMCRICNWSDL